MLHFYFSWKDVSAYLDILNEWCTVFYSKYIFINFTIIFLPLVYAILKLHPYYHCKDKD